MWEDDDAEEMSQDDHCDPEKEQRRVEGLPIYQKAEEIRDLTRRIIDSIDNEEIRMLHSNVMLEASIQLSEEIARAEAVDNFILKMERATLVKIHARSLQTQSASIVFDGMVPEEYLNLLRKEIEAFRLLFRGWVRTFHSARKHGDGWGLFLDDQAD